MDGNAVFSIMLEKQAIIDSDSDSGSDDFINPRRAIQFAVTPPY